MKLLLICHNFDDIMTFFGGLLLLLALAILQVDIGAASATVNGSYLWQVKRLHNHLMDDYKTSIRPVNHPKESITVDLTLSAFTIDDLDERNQAFHISGYMYQKWTDAGLVWNSEEFSGLTSMKIPISDLWYPDVYVMNSRDAHYVPPTHHMALVTYDGAVMWIPPVNIEAHCELDLTEFPFDRHDCSVIFASWSHNDLAINLTSSYPYADQESIAKSLVRENLEWNLEKVTIKRNEKRYSCCESDVFPDITYTFTIARRSTFATHLFVGPSAILCLVTPAIFLLPPGGREKITFGIGVLIADTLLLGELINYIPTPHPNLPLIAKYFLANIVMASLSLAISVIIIGFWDKGSTRLSGPPAIFRLLVLGPLATVLCVKKDDFHPVDESSSGFSVDINPDATESTSGVDPESDKKRFMSNFLRNAARSEWRQLAVVFDRLLFVIYCVIVAILTLSFARYM